MQPQLKSFLTTRILLIYQWPISVINLLWRDYKPVLFIGVIDDRVAMTTFVLSIFSQSSDLLWIWLTSFFLDSTEVLWALNFLTDFEGCFSTIELTSFEICSVGALFRFGAPPSFFVHVSAILSYASNLFNEL